MWDTKLKEAGVNIHVIATGGGAGLQQRLWEIPGSSAFLSGATFPYDQDEQAELLGFMPEKFCSEEAAVDLASAAYMKAYKFGGKKAVGLGITASVASLKAHRGDHRVFACIITDTEVRLLKYTLEKGVGAEARKTDGRVCDDAGFALLYDMIWEKDITKAEDVTELARKRFFERPFFSYDGRRFKEIPDTKGYAMMPGSFNPPHSGHLGLAQEFRRAYGSNVVFEVGTNPPHKEHPTVQELLQRAKMLQGQDRFFTKDIGLYVEKAKAYPRMKFVIGADTMLRMLDPKWGVDIKDLLSQFAEFKTTFVVAGRMIGEDFWSCEDVLHTLPSDLGKYCYLFHPLDGRWDISSSELRAKVENKA